MVSLSLQGAHTSTDPAIDIDKTLLKAVAESGCRSRGGAVACAGN